MEYYLVFTTTLVALYVIVKTKVLNWHLCHIARAYIQTIYNVYVFVSTMFILCKGINIYF